MCLKAYQISFEKCEGWQAQELQSFSVNILQPRRKNLKLREIPQLPGVSQIMLSALQSHPLDFTLQKKVAGRQDLGTPI